MNPNNPYEYITVWNEKTYLRSLEESVLVDSDNQIKNKLEDRHRHLFGEIDKNENNNNTPWKKQYDTILEVKMSWGSEILKKINTIIDKDEGIINSSFEESTNVELIPLQHGNTVTTLVQSRDSHSNISNKVWDIDNYTLYVDEIVKIMNDIDIYDRNKCINMFINIVQYILDSKWKNIDVFDSCVLLMNESLKNNTDLKIILSHAMDFKKLVNQSSSIFDKIRNELSNNNSNYLYLNNDIKKH